MASGDTVASGNVKLGVDVTPMEQGLEAAKAKAEAGAAAVQAAVNTATTTSPQAAASSVSSAATIVTAAEATVKTEAAAKATEAATSKFVQFKRSIDAVAGGFRGAVSAITGVVGAFTGLLAVVGLVVTAVVSVTRAITEKSRVAKQAKKDLEGLTEASRQLAERRLDKYTRDPEGDRLKDLYKQQWKEEESLFYERQKAARKLYRGQRAEALQAIEEERLARKEALDEELKKRLEGLERQFILNQNMAKTAADFAANEMARATQQANSSMSQSLDRMEVSISKIGELVEALRRNTGRDA